MTAPAVQVLLWIGVGAGATGIASWLAHRSYRRFLRKARGPASVSLRRGEFPQNSIHSLIRWKHRIRANPALRRCSTMPTLSQRARFRRHRRGAASI